ncbi:Oidioi.mRNA.OKI2018_I69.PAR.g9872.t1.cds [Oikopleura dioica]|uniref:Oidioi.mRNA.OKI2018_I69.PAR.g9872.t1.cds n=1 Tax=Oikopleura dioica TaxID=34765 RepID=A0ABN7RQL7_OIKDI|nr:Oidioi.mRNA.OKI2018_I69.PAR.g9872.t1.cds [Oikopleura dioica]
MKRPEEDLDESKTRIDILDENIQSQKIRNQTGVSERSFLEAPNSKENEKFSLHGCGYAANDCVIICPCNSEDECPDAAKCRNNFTGTDTRKKLTTTEEPTKTTFTTTTTVEDTTPEKIQEAVVDEAGEEGPGEEEQMLGNYNNNNYKNQYLGELVVTPKPTQAQTLGKPPICFDYDPETLDDLVLPFDPSGLSFVAKMFENEKGRKFLKSVNIRSPEGESINVSTENGLETEVEDMKESGEGFETGCVKVLVLTIESEHERIHGRTHALTIAMHKEDAVMNLKQPVCSANSTCYDDCCSAFDKKVEDCPCNANCDTGCAPKTSCTGSYQCDFTLTKENVRVYICFGSYNKDFNYRNTRYQDHQAGNECQIFDGDSD